MGKGGRPTVMTVETVNKLEEVFALGGTDEEACFYANISKQTLYDYQDKHPEYVDRKEQLKLKPFLKARQTVAKDLDKTDTAKWYLERKGKKEFGNQAQDVVPPSQIIINVLGNPEAKKLSEQMDKVLIKNIYEGEIINNASQDSGQTREQSREPELSEPTK